VLVRALQEAPLALLEARLDAGSPESGLQLVNRLADQLPPGPAPAGGGSAHVFLLHLLSTRLLPAPAAPMGRLVLKWRRQQEQQEQQQQQKGPQEPPAEVETALDLPRVTVAEAALSARVAGPPSVTAGIAFPLQLRLSNATGAAADVSLVVQDAPGFVFSGDKAQTLLVPPRGESRVVWHLVAHATGELPLPSVRVSAPRLGASVLTQGAMVQVMPF
jgi:hypothetical protein